MVNYDKNYDLGYEQWKITKNSVSAGNFMMFYPYVRGVQGFYLFWGVRKKLAVLFRGYKPHFRTAPNFTASFYLQNEMSSYIQQYTYQIHKPLTLDGLL